MKPAVENANLVNLFARAEFLLTLLALAKQNAGFYPWKDRYLGDTAKHFL